MLAFRRYVQNGEKSCHGGHRPCRAKIPEDLTGLTTAPGIRSTPRRIELSKDRGIAVVRSPLSGRRSPEFFIPGTKIFPAHDPVGSIRYILAGM